MVYFLQKSGLYVAEGNTNDKRKEKNEKITL